MCIIVITKRKPFLYMYRPTINYYNWTTWQECHVGQVYKLQICIASQTLMPKNVFSKAII